VALALRDRAAGAKLFGLNPRCRWWAPSLIDFANALLITTMANFLR
jgi:hypothetical protein